MKKFLIIAFVPLALSACLKSNNGVTCSDVDPSTEAPTMQAYCMANGINYTVDSSGIYYQILNPGVDPKPTLNSTVSVTYLGKLLNGTTVDSTSTPRQFVLGGLISAWQIALQKIGKGGQMKMVAPSSLCYGCYGYIQIPANAILYFDITLTDVQ